MLTLNISVEPLGSDIREAYGRLLPEQNVFGEHFLDWKFDRTPAERGRFSVARNESGKIIGLSAYMAAKFLLGSHRRGLGLQAIDSVVAEEARGQGLFTKLARRMSDSCERGVDLIWGFPNANAAPAWFGKLEWQRHGYAPFLVRPLRAGYLLRKLGLPFDFRLSFRSQTGGGHRSGDITDAVSDQWLRFASPSVRCSVERDSSYLRWRLAQAPHRSYRLAFSADHQGGLVASTIAQKHGGSIAYVMEAFGGSQVRDMLAAELGALTDEGAEVALAWCFPWSPNYSLYRSLGFLPLPERLRPVEIHFGSRSYSSAAVAESGSKSWYLSYLDSDTI